MKFARLCAGTALGLATSTQPASAQSAPAPTPQLSADEKARELFLQGDRLYAEGSYLDAVDAFKRAYGLSARPALLFNVANALERLGRYEEALQYLHRFAPEAPAHQRHIVLKRIQAIERLADAQRQPRIRPPVKVPASPTSAPPLAPPADAAVAPPWQTAGYALVGVGTLSVVAGTFAAFAARRSHEQAQRDCQPTDTGGILCPDTAQSALGDEQSTALLADVGWVVGAAALGVGLYLVLDVPTGSGTSTHLSVSAASRGGKMNLVTHF